MNLKKREIQACTIIDGIQDELKSISLFLHNNPELGQHEVRAVQTISGYMEQHGFDTTVGLTKRPELRTAMRSDIGLERLHKMAFLGEYDALPELGHGCGHNLIAIMSMGAAIALVKPLAIHGERHFLDAQLRRPLAARCLWLMKDFLKAMMGH